MTSGKGGEWAWLTRSQAAELCGTSPRNFDERIRPLLAEGSERGEARHLRYHAPSVAAALVKYRQPAPASDDESDPLLKGEGSPNLERYRGVKADLSELDLAERRSILVRRSVIAEAMQAGTIAMRQAGDRLTRQFGNEAGSLFNEALSDFEQTARRVIADAGDRNSAGDGADGPDAGPGAPDDRTVRRG